MGSGRSKESGRGAVGLATYRSHIMSVGIVCVKAVEISTLCEDFSFS